jgi:hypothetical protein
MMQAGVPENLRAAFQKDIDSLRHFKGSLDRAAYSRAIVGQYIARHRSQAHPKIILVAGGTASGKTGVTVESAAQRLNRDYVSVNSDDIRTGAPEFPLFVGASDAKNEKSVTLLHEEAGRIRDQVLDAARRGRMNVLLDAPGSQRVAKILRQFKRAGYESRPAAPSACAQSLTIGLKTPTTKHGARWPNTGASRFRTRREP